MRRKPDAGCDWPGTLKRGFGCGCGIWGGGGRPQCIVDVNVEPRRVRSIVSCGTQDLGTGTRTYMVAIVAEELGLEMSDVKEEIGDTRLGNANFSGRFIHGGVSLAGGQSRGDQRQSGNRQGAGPGSGARPEDVVFADRKISCQRQDTGLESRLAPLCPRRGFRCSGEWKPGLSIQRNTWGMLCRSRGGYRNRPRSGDSHSTMCRTAACR